MDKYEQYRFECLGHIFPIDSQQLFNEDNMAYIRKERTEVTKLPNGALTVSQYAKNEGCSYTNIFKQADKGKVTIVRFCGVSFVLAPKNKV